LGGGAIPQFSFFLENECQNMFSHNILHQKSVSPLNLRPGLQKRWEPWEPGSRKVRNFAGSLRL